MNRAAVAADPALTAELAIGPQSYRYWPLDRVARADEQRRWPYVHRILLEHLARTAPDQLPALQSVLRGEADGCEIPLQPDRVMLHDTTCLPALADLAALRDIVAKLGGDPDEVNPAIPVDLVVDHSVTVEEYGTPLALGHNLTADYGRNAERYQFIRWAEQSLRNFRVVPPGKGIIHQVNMEILARVVWPDAGPPVGLHPELMLATDSHTPMINALGVLAWGVGGLEGQSALLGEPVTIAFPRVVGVRLTGRLAPGVTGTDLALTVTQRLREYGVLGTFIEFTGPGLDDLTVADRATVANMAPEYGATCAYFPFDDQTLAYLRLTSRDKDHCQLVESYMSAQGLKRRSGDGQPSYRELIDIDLATVQTTMAGPRRPDQRRTLAEVPASFLAETSLPASTEITSAAFAEPVPLGAVAIAAITSCTNTANPALMIRAGLLARKAIVAGLTSKPWVKTSLSPGSRAVTRYLDAAGLTAPLATLGFSTVGYGCMTCIGNSGPLQPDLAKLADDGLPVAAVLSGNRNFEGRINPRINLAYLGSPPLVVAYALAGTITRDLTTEPLGHDAQGRPVFLRDLWPDDAETQRVIAEAVRPEFYQETAATVRDSDSAWRDLSVQTSTRYAWDPDSTYVRRPPYLTGIGRETRRSLSVERARPLLWLGDNVTTDHISPAGAIPADSDAGRYLRAHGIPEASFNQYSTRRSNHEVMLRGAFTNPAVRNLLLPPGDLHRGGYAYTADLGRITTAYEAAATYRDGGIDTVILAGRNYGAGSSRDWGAKAPALLGVRAVVAESFERLHRSNLIGMGVLPLLFSAGDNAGAHGFTAADEISLDLPGSLWLGGNPVLLTVRRDGTVADQATVTLHLDTRTELAHLRNGGLLPYIARSMAVLPAAAS